jgi:hypothetical protein
VVGNLTAHPASAGCTNKKESAVLTRIAVAAALVAATATIALATEFDPGPGSRYPALAAPIATKQVQDVPRTAPVSLNSGQNAATTGQPYEIYRRNRASLHNAGGVG